MDVPVQDTTSSKSDAWAKVTPYSSRDTEDHQALLDSAPPIRTDFIARKDNPIDAKKSNTQNTAFKSFYCYPGVHTDNPPKNLTMIADSGSSKKIKAGVIKCVIQIETVVRLNRWKLPSDKFNLQQGRM